MIQDFKKDLTNNIVTIHNIAEAESLLFYFLIFRIKIWEMYILGKITYVLKYICTTIII